MASKQSWAEKRWWRGTVFDWMGVLLAIALVFVLAFVSVPFLLLQPYGVKRPPGLLPHRLSFDLCKLGASHRSAAVRAAAQRCTQARLRRRRRRAAAGAEREPPADAFEGRDRRWGQRAAVRAGIRMADGSSLRGAVQADSGECPRQPARHPLVDVGPGSGDPCCDRSWATRATVARPRACVGAKRCAARNC